MKRKVRIKSLPQGYHMMPDGTIMKDSAHMAEGGTVNKNLSPIPRGMANLEAEKGEVAMTDLGNTGMMGLYNIGGERHSNGGTPLNLDPGSFIYSDTKKMKIKDPEFLAKYGKTKPTTPAKLVKPFLGVNDFTNTLYDQNADSIQKRTAQSMIDKYKGKAGEIAFYQEAMKGFPQGIPAVAEDYAESIMGAPMMAYGGYIPKAQSGMSVKDKKQSFVAQYAPIAQRVGAQFNIDPSIILAQAALESGWGTSSLFKRSNNLFGVMAAGKPNQYWEGRKTEGRAGNFRVYPSVEDSMADFARLIRDKKEYSSAYKVADNPEAYARAIAQSPYISEKNNDNRANYERGLKNNALEIQRLLPTAISSTPGAAPRRTSGTSALGVPGNPFVTQVYNVAPTLMGNITVPAGQVPVQQTTATSPAKPSRSDKFQAINPDLLRVLSEAGLNPLMDVSDYSDKDRLEYNRIQSQVAGYPGMYEDATKNFPGWVKRMESLGYDFSDWKDAQGNFDLKSLQGQDPRVRAYQEWWNPRVEQFITEENTKRKNAGYPAFTEAEEKAIRTQKFSDSNDPNAQPGSKIDSRLGTYTTSRLLAEGKYPAKEPVEEPKPNTSIVEDKEIENKESKESITNQQAPDPGFQPWLQDLNNLRTATRNMLSENRYFGYAPRLPYRPMDAVYLDDTRQQQQIAGRARGTMEALGAFAGPARQASMASVISGQAGEQAANVASQIGNANVNIANTVEGNNARMMANTDAANAELAMNLYDKNVTTQEVFDEKMRRYRNLNTALKNNMITNAYKTKAMNKINPLFQVMPGVGGDIVFNPGVSAASFNVDDYASQAERINNAYKSEIENIKSLGLSPEEQSKQLAKLQELRVQSLFGASAKSKGAAYDPTSYLYPGNPYGTGVGGQ
jgi:flagellar protein FlgJ